MSENAPRELVRLLPDAIDAVIEADEIANDSRLGSISVEEYRRRFRKLKRLGKKLRKALEGLR